MAFKCSECGETHDELPRYWMFKRPEDRDGEPIPITEDRKSMARAEERCFVLCEVEIPIVGGKDGVLGFIVWVEVRPADYERLLAFRDNEEASPDWHDWVKGTLANPITGVPKSFGTPVKFAVVKKDPTPYVKWVKPGTPLAKQIEAGASHQRWHDLAEGRV